MLTEVRLGQGTEKPEAGHQANAARVILVFTKKGHRLANRNIRWFIFEFENLHTVKIDNYEIQIKQFNSGCQAPRNHIRQLKMD